MVWEQLHVLFSFTLQASKWHIYIVLSKDGIYIFTKIAVVNPSCANPLSRTISTHGFPTLKKTQTNNNNIKHEN
jgi:hypothetical protein